ncbi:MAG: hypothetical protein EBZ36_08200 [Acidobacteria bacterium]|nr:hypothetical protein [Acidobacteriota bacterium]
MTSINNCWLGFELNILRRLKFTSIAIPFAGRASLDWYLKFWGKEVYSNDLCLSSSSVARAYVENCGETLSEAEIDLLLDEIYVPSNEMRNRALTRYWSEIDAVWFDNLRERIDLLESPYARALAISHGLQTGEYARSFNRETLKLRQPLSTVFRHQCERQRRIIDNGRRNRSSNLEAADFVRGLSAEAMFVRFPGPGGLASWNRSSAEWREVWVRRDPGEWDRLVANQHGKLGDHVHSKGRYLDLVANFLSQAGAFPTWVISHTEDGFVSIGELATQIQQLRRIDAIYHKDFSEVVGGGNTYLLVVC